MYIEDMFYRFVGTAREIVGSGLAVAGLLWLVGKAMTAVCLAFGIEAK